MAQLRHSSKQLFELKHGIERDPRMAAVDPRNAAVDHKLIAPKDDWRAFWRQTPTADERSAH